MNAITWFKVIISWNNNKCILLLSSIITMAIAEVSSLNPGCLSDPQCNPVRSKLKSDLKSTIKTSPLPKTLQDRLQLRNWAKRQRTCKIWKIIIILIRQWLQIKGFPRALTIFLRTQGHQALPISNRLNTTSSIMAIIITTSICQIKTNIIRIHHSKANTLIMGQPQLRPRSKGYNSSKTCKVNIMIMVVQMHSRIKRGKTTLGRNRIILYHPLIWVSSCSRRAPVEACIRLRIMNIVIRSILRASTLQMPSSRTNQITKTTPHPLTWVNMKTIT